ncbi:hypothetical protein Btru_066043 [Bulinus truncatus]|nr:hypothetical protein Btru_066043 [Bulinus truncatus]
MQSIERLTMSETDNAVKALYEEVWEWQLADSPELATFCGIHHYDDLWDDISEESYLRRENCLKDFLKKAESIDISSCSSDGALNHLLLTDSLKLYLQGLRFKSYLMPISYLEGIHYDCNLTISFMKFNTEDHFNKYISRLEKLPQKVDMVIDALKQGVKEGIVQHSASVRQIPSQIELAVTTPLDKHELLKPFRENHHVLEKSKFDLFKLKAEELLQSKICPAFLRLKDYLQNEYFMHLRSKEGINSLPNGDKWYQQCLEFHLTFSLTPLQIHELGLKEVARIEERIHSIANMEGFDAALPEIAAALIERQRNSFSNREEVLDYIQNLCYNRIRPKVMQYFKNLSDIPMIIRSAPDFMKNAPLAFYKNGTPDGSREGCYYINSHNLDECYPFQLPSISLHEGEPGHHLQCTIALSATHLPSFRRYTDGGKHCLCPAKFGTNTAFSEGWGLYAEYLGEELNIYENNLELLGRYSYEAFRAARLVVDTGLHALGWSREQAIQYMVDHTLSSRSEVTKEVNRYITIPGQACAYKIGEIKIKELRQKAELSLGTKFDIKEFHHCILSYGRIPIRILETIIEQYIDNCTG